MRALITGAGGQLGRELVTAAPSGIEVLALLRDQLDVTDESQVVAVLENVSPDLVVNAAAYTAVDRAEEEPDLASATNAQGVGHLAGAVARSDGRLIHISTDYVFDGVTSRPYGPDDAPNPLSAYGRSKLDGERASLELGVATVIRTSRLYSVFGGNFVTGMLGRMAKGEELAVVDDQISSPTWTAGLAQVLWRFAGRPDLTGIWHWCDAGACSWFDWARAIQEEGVRRKLLDRVSAIRRVATSDYPAAATRPAFSALDCSRTVAELDVQQRPWREALGSMLDEMAVRRSKTEGPADSL